MATLRRFPVVVEVFGWDEALLGASAGDPEALVGEIQLAVPAETGLRCSVGVGHSKLQAKLATGFPKGPSRGAPCFLPPHRAGPLDAAAPAHPLG